MASSKISYPIRNKVYLGKLDAIDAQVAMGNYEHYYLRFNINDYFYSQLYEIDTKQRHQITFGAGAWIAAYQVSRQTGNYLQWVSETDIAGTRPSTWTIKIDVYAS